MNNLEIESTPKTPSINFNADTGVLIIEGRLIPEDPQKFFSLLTDWLARYKPASGIKTLMRVRLHYYNSTSIKRLLHLFQALEGLHAQGHEIKINWEYEEGDDDSIMDGEDYKSLLKVPFEIVKVE